MLLWHCECKDHAAVVATPRTAFAGPCDAIKDPSPASKAGPPTEATYVHARPSLAKV